MPRPVERRPERTVPDRPPDAPLPEAARPPDLHPVVRLQGEIGNAAVTRLLAREPDEPPITAPGIVGMQQWNERGIAHFKAGRYEKARAAFAAAYDLEPISTFLYDQAEALEKLNRPDEAAKMYERYLAEGPLTADIPKVKSRIRKLRGEQVPEGEDDDLPPITAKGKAGAQEWFDRAQAWFLAGRFAQAADGFRHAFELVPLPEFLFNEGTALEKGRHPAAAANAFEHYLIVASGADDRDLVIAKIKMLRGQVPPKTDRSLIDPEDEPAEAPAVTAKGVAGAREWYDRGAIAFQVGDFKRAYDCFVSAYDLKPYPAFVFNQASSLDGLGNTDAAIQAYERYLALDPKASDAEKVRARIKVLRAGPAGAAQLKTP